MRHLRRLQSCRQKPQPRHLGSVRSQVVAKGTAAVVVAAAGQCSTILALRTNEISCQIGCNLARPNQPFRPEGLDRLHLVDCFAPASQQGRRGRTRTWCPTDDEETMGTSN